MKTMNDKQFPADALRFWKLAPDTISCGWDIFIGHAHSENMCDPVSHYIFKDVITIFKHLRGYIDHEDRHVGELLNEIIRYDLRNSELCVTDASFSEQIGIGVAISFKMNFNTVENYSVIFSYFK